MKNDNLKVRADLRKAGADVRLVHNRDGPGLHLKAALCDGIAYLDDCNWNAADMVLRDDNAAHVRAIRQAVLGSGPDREGSLALDKSAALSDEARVLSRAKRRADVETECVGVSAVSGALRRLANAGVHCRLLVSERGARDKAEQKRIASLEAAGIEVRATRAAEKLAIAGDRAWVGSADATCAYGKYDYIDWGLPTRDPSIVRELGSRFNLHWAESVPV